MEKILVFTGRIFHCLVLRYFELSFRISAGSVKIQKLAFAQISLKA